MLQTIITPAMYTVSQKHRNPYTHGNNYVVFCFNGISFLPH